MPKWPRSLRHFCFIEGWRGQESGGDTIESKPDGVNINDGLHHLRATKHMKREKAEFKIAVEESEE